MDYYYLLGVLLSLTLTQALSLTLSLSHLTHLTHTLTLPLSPHSHLTHYHSLSVLYKIYHRGFIDGINGVDVDLDLNICSFVCTEHIHTIVYLLISPFLELTITDFLVFTWFHSCCQCVFLPIFVSLALSLFTCLKSLWSDMIFNNPPPHQ